MRTLYGPILIIVILPLIYSLLTYSGVRYSYVSFISSDKAIAATIAVAFPLIVTGIIKWWDLWVKPSPKLGAPWLPMRPRQFVVKVLFNHGTVLLLIALAASVTYMNRLDSPSDAINRGSFYAPYLLVFMVFMSTFNTPRMKGFDSGQPIQK
ncbi:hypothetical protein BH11PLA2_BH11PLA2_31270 [soil metagenome]